MDDKENYPSEQEARELLVQAGHVLYDQGYVVTNDGNISLKIAPDVIVVTPHGISKGSMNPDMMIVMDLDGTVLNQAEGWPPSSEVKMHLRAYRENPAINAVVHAHPIYATAYAIAGIALDEPILCESALQTGIVPVAHYAEPGTNEVPDSIAPYVNEYGAVLLSNHGVLTWGSNLDEAMSRMEVVENYAQISFVVRQLGSMRRLSKGQVRGLARIRRNMNMSPVVLPTGVEFATNTVDVL